MTAIKFPEGMKAGDLLPLLAKRDIVVAGGLHKDIKDTYFRVGLMGRECEKTRLRKRERAIWG